MLNNKKEIVRSDSLQVRVRFAPSPTGDIHIGNARSALYNFLFARKMGGEFFLRIEDTDRERYIPESVPRIYETLKWLGLNWDGKPVIQSKRLNLYKRYAEELVKNGHAYYCFCSEERLARIKKEQEAKNLPPGYDRHCRDLNQSEIKENLKLGKSSVIRLKVPLTGIIEFEDLIKGKVSFDLKIMDDPILLKSDGYPTYHLASVLDDHEMQITHVIRSDEWLPSTPKHLLLYQFFKWQPPVFVHLPIILGPDKSKLSKRHGATSVLEFREQGYLKEALVNFMAFLGWNPGDEREIFSLLELVQTFELEKVHKAPAIFNIEKLDWLNGYYIRQKSLAELTTLCLPYFVSANLIKEVGNMKYEVIDTREIVNFDWLKKIVALEQERIKKLSEVKELTEFFFKDKLEYSPELLIWKKMKPSEVGERLKILIEFFSGLDKKDFRKEILENKLKSLVQEKKLGTGETFWPLRVALTGRKASPGPFEVAQILGKEKVLKRIKRAMDLVI